jgi:glucosamine-6-phosphate deaminase
MRLHLARDAAEFAQLAAEHMIDRVRRDPSLSLTLPTGSTPKGLYEILVREHALGRFDLERAAVFMLDEYVDLADYPAGSFYSFLRDSLGPLVFNESTAFARLAPSLEPSVAARYDAELDARGGLDLAVLGVGRNGHIGFNEPGTPRDARTHVVELAPATLEANFADHPEAVRPRRAVTIGLADLLGARSMLMLVAGRQKREVAARLAEGRVDDSLPATLALGHRDLTIVMEAGLLG